MVQERGKGGEGSACCTTLQSQMQADSAEAPARGERPRRRDACRHEGAELQIVPR
jgi:hypothetical protein